MNSQHAISWSISGVFHAGLVAALAWSTFTEKAEWLAHHHRGSTVIELTLNDDHGEHIEAPVHFHSPDLLLDVVPQDFEPPLENLPFPEPVPVPPSTSPEPVASAEPPPVPEPPNILDPPDLSEATIEPVATKLDQQESAALTDVSTLAFIDRQTVEPTAKRPSLPALESQASRQVAASAADVQLPVTSAPTAPRNVPRAIADPVSEPAPVAIPVPAAEPRATPGEAVDELPKKLASNPKPPYPSDAFTRGIEGRVLLEVQINAQGLVEDLRVIQSSGVASLDRSATDTVRTWRFQPARKGGVPVSFVVNVPIRFSIPNR